MDGMKAAPAGMGGGHENVRVAAKADGTILPHAPRLCIRRADARLFLEDLVPGAHLRRFAFQTFADRKDGDPRLARTIFGPFDQVARTLVDLNRRGAGIFVALNAFRHDAKERTNANVTGYRTCWLDLDGAPLDPVLQGAVPPHVVNMTSPGRWHAFWRIKDDTHEAAWRAVQASLAERFDGDPSMNKPAGVVRLPGFIHQKGAPFRVETIQRIEHASPIDPLAAFDVDLPAAADGQRKFAEPLPDRPLTEGERHASIVSLAGTLRTRNVPLRLGERWCQEFGREMCGGHYSDAQIAKKVADIYSRYEPGEAWRAPGDAEDATNDEWAAAQGEAFARWAGAK